MIPLTLRIQNFLSYGSPVQTIDFSNYKLMCLSGKNGHGKSALLDAMTWALWGQARKTGGTSKADMGVLKQGKTDLMVVFDFAFNNQTYRVKRVFSTKYGKPKAHVDFGTYNRETDYFTPLTEKTIRKTQECIDKTLGLDYEAFINSAFLRQGQANEFSKKSPKDRKEVLASILGLHRFEKAKKLALEQSRRTAQEKEHLEKLAEHIAKECEQSTTIEKQLIDVTKSLDDYAKQEQQLTKEQTLLNEQKETLQKKEQEHKQLLFAKTEKQKTYDQQHQQLLEAVALWKKTHAQLLELPDKTVLEERKAACNKQLAEYQQNLQKHLTQKETFLKLKETEQEQLLALKNKSAHELQSKKTALEQHKHAWNLEEQKKITALQEQEKLEKQHKEYQKEIDTLKKNVDPELLIEDTKELQEKFDRYKMFYQKWIEQGNMATNELESLRGKQNLQDKDNPSCPLCEQNLSLARKRFLQKKFTEQERFLQHRLKRLTALIAWVKEMLIQQHTTLETSKKIDLLLQQQNNCTPALEQQKKVIQEQEKKVTAAQALFTKAEKELTTYKASLAKVIEQDTDYKKIKQQRETVEKELKVSAPNTQQQEAITKELATLESKLAQWSTFAQQQAEQQERKKQTDATISTLKELKTEITRINKEIKTFDNLVLEIKKNQEQQTLLQEKQKTIVTHKDTMLQQKGSLEAQQRKLKERGQEQKRCAQEAKHRATTHQEYQAISQSFGKDGIQALLIEEALPEIEQEANELLARLTDNQTHIFIESLRDLKKGGTRETLDINISDTNGIRPYEMFSGGEAFRIDFALRIAISKLLARRAGTSLQTLIIDEGFGSQDEEGLTRIMDVLYKIQDDFEKIIIVSHLTSMKDQFPVHFVVTKEPQGSKVTIKELG